jgi:DNA-binding NtrC family response regulator
MPGHQVLIIEDEFLIRLTLTEALSEAGFEVIEAETAEEALAALEANPGILLMLTDIQLPGSVNGLELVRSVRARMPEMPVIYMTGRPDTMGGQAASPRDVFIVKPYLPSEICAIARRLTGA